MSARPNPVMGAIVGGDGQLQPVAGAEATEMTMRPDQQAASPVPLAMTGGRQISAARRMAADEWPSATILRETCR